MSYIDIYTDWDNTLFATKLYAKEILIRQSNKIAELISEDPNIIHENILKSFNSTTANFFSLAKSLSQKYNIPYEILEKELIDTMLSSSKFVFEDAKKFLQTQKQAGKKTSIITFVSGQQNLTQQAFKLAGSGILDLVDEIYITTMLKYNLDLNFNNKIILDDSPRDLKGLYYRLHPELSETTDAKEILTDLNIQYINSNEIYDTQSFNNTIIKNLTNYIIQETSTNPQEIKEYISTFDLTLLNYDTIIDCLSAKFKINKELLKEVVNSTLKTSTSNVYKNENTSPLYAIPDGNIHTTIASYNIKSQNITQHLLQLAYSGVLPYAEGLYITSQPCKEVPNQKNFTIKTGALYRINKPHNEKRTSKPIEIPDESSIPVFTNFENIPRNIDVKLLEKN